MSRPISSAADRSVATPGIDATPDTRHGAILYIENVTVAFDGFKALDDLTLYIDRMSRPLQTTLFNKLPNKYRNPGANNPPIRNQGFL